MKDTGQLKVRLDSELLARLKAYAAKRGWSLQYLGVKALSAYLDARKEEK